MAMKVAYYWIIYSCLIFGSSILCDRQLPRRPSSSFFSGDNDDIFYCSNGLDIEWSLVCDGHKDCSDGLDETKELCARYEYGTNISMDCGSVSNESKKEHVLKETPWIVDIYEIYTLHDVHFRSGLGSIISPNLVVASAYIFSHKLMEYSSNNISKSYNLFKIDIPLQTDNENNHHYIDVKMIYLNPNKYEYKLAVIVLANKISFSNGVTPVCIDWYGKYNVLNGAYVKINGLKKQFGFEHIVLQRFFRHINNTICRLDNCIKLQLDRREFNECSYQTVSIFYSNSYFLSGISQYWKNQFEYVLDFIDIKYYVPWIRGILNKHSTANLCVLPTIEGVVHSYKGSNSILSPGSLINPNTTVIENCEVRYHKAHQNGFRVCQRYGIWKTAYDKLCFKMCPPLLSDSLDIKCSYYGKYANCSYLSIPDTIATPKCKPTYALPNGNKETPIELHCLPNGLWNNQLYICNPPSSCVLPIVEGVVYTYIDSNESLHHGTLINLGVTINENCTFGYHNVYPTSFRVCQRNGKWKTSNQILCLKMCLPLLSNSLDITCSYNSTYADCSNLSIPDTIATSKCKPAYTLPNGQNETQIELHCQSNGTWNNELYTCDLVCGRPFIKAQTLIKNGETANVATAPWNVAVYKKTSNYDFICGGSIVSRNLVISAAHCFWKKGMLCNVTIFDGLYKIGAGKYYRNFTINEDEFPQIINVDRIHLKEGYFGQPGYYAEDIAVVVLQKSVSFSNGITPICIDWHGNYNVPNGVEGQVVGWGSTENDSSSPILLKTILPYIDLRTCRDMCKEGFQVYVTADKFCAGSTSVSGSSVSMGDSGAGLCFSHFNLYYLTGVVSLNDPYGNNSIGLFTSVYYHINWIRRLYNHYKEVQYN